MTIFVPVFNVKICLTIELGSVTWRSNGCYQPTHHLTDSVPWIEFFLADNELVLNVRVCMHDWFLENDSKALFTPYVFSIL